MTENEKTCMSLYVELKEENEFLKKRNDYLQRRIRRIVKNNA